MYKKTLITLSCIFAFTTSSLAYNHPTPFVEFQLNESETNSLIGENKRDSPNKQIISFLRNTKKSELINSPNAPRTYKIDKSIKDYEIYHWQEDFITNSFLTKPSALFLYRKNEDEPFGYCLAEPIILDIAPDDPAVIAIRNLTVNLNYYKGKNFKNITVKSYEKDHGNYIERYMVVYFREDTQILVVDAMYPKTSEKDVSKFINDKTEEIAKSMYDDFVKK